MTGANIIWEEKETKERGLQVERAPCRKFADDLLFSVQRQNNSQVLSGGWNL
jgi:hypothetical protein